MINRLRRWLYRRIQGAPTTPLSVLNTGPWTIDRIERELRGGFDHDRVQLAADLSAYVVDDA